MSGFQLTSAQERAVNTICVPMLVSAAAGSGKTRVLTERLVARVQEGEDITRFLVITFTRAAAAELRGRILTELNGLLAENPGDRRLRRQSALLYRAKIGTIDSFCTDLVRENAHLLGISPSFSILEEEKAQTMRAKAQEHVLSRAYDTIEEDEGLRLLVDS
ncbi:MAG: UvrD-helicase domain-containing protein, partial [Oscillospiraceae bacterium]|nr:UvrD-helicase domain-containing protein [Oscillospiraceae bacterium]